MSQRVIESVVLTASAAVKASGGFIWGMIVNDTDAGADCACVLDDSTDGSGTDKLALGPVTTQGGPGVAILARPIPCPTGIYATIAGDAQVTVLYE